MGIASGCGMAFNRALWLLNGSKKQVLRRWRGLRPASTPQDDNV